MAKATRPRKKAPDGTGDVVSLEAYRAKRDFARTPEPDAAKRADAAQAEGRLFCVQQHAARRMHWDLRLQFGDALKSWAVPQGPSLDTKIRRLAVHVEDHPLDYARFEGVIPKGNYGAGQVIVWDIGEWVPTGDPDEGYAKGSLKFRLLGGKLRGGWTLVRIKGDRQKGDNWLLIKERDLEVRPEAEYHLVEEQPESVLSGRRVGEVTEEAPDVEEAAPAGEEARKPARARAPARKPPQPGRLPGARKAALKDVPPPQLASSIKAPPDDAGWLHEIKFDGYRTAARVQDGLVRFITRGGLDWTDRYGRLALPFKKLACKEALVDGEVLVQDEQGLSSFAALQDALADGRTERLTFFAFDLLHLDGYDLSDVPLIKRKELLRALIEPVADTTSALHYSEHVAGQGAAFYRQAASLGLEGVISKRADAPYRSGRSRSWLKSKCLMSDEFVIVGYVPSDVAGGGLGALLVAAPDGDGGLVYAGRVGTGFKQRVALDLKARLDALARKTAPVKLPPEDRRGNVVWVRPALQAEITYLTRTADGLLRHAAFKGLRPDKEETPGEVAPEKTPAAAPRRRLIRDSHLASIWVTNPDRRMFSDDGPTKLELALYYARVGDWMLPEIAKRPVSLVRCPDGRLQSCFFQRHVMPGMPDSVKRIALREEGKRERGDYLYVEDADGFLALPQFGAVEMHAWGCRIDKPERPDRMVLDLDPDEGLPWREVVDAALEVRALLDELGLPVFLKTTGGKGLHLVVPLARRQGWKEVLRFSQGVASHMAASEPKRYVATMAKRARRGRIFLDYLRNGRSATAVAAYSLRARAHVSVSMPLTFEELSHLDDPADLDYASVPARLEATGFVDPWAEIDSAAKALTREAERKLGIAE